MTEQANPTAEEPKVAEEPKTETVVPAPAKPAAPTPVVAAAPVAVQAPAQSTDNYSVPSEFQPDSVGRPRRIGANIRVNEIDYKNIPMLTRFIDGRGRILSRRKTRVSAKVQRQIVTAIKRARHLALLPYTADQSRIVRKRR